LRRCVRRSSSRRRSPSRTYALTIWSMACDKDAYSHTAKRKSRHCCTSDGFPNPHGDHQNGHTDDTLKPLTPAYSRSSRAVVLKADMRPVARKLDFRLTRWSQPDRRNTLQLGQFAARTVMKSRRLIRSPDQHRRSTLRVFRGQALLPP
jgi:hypothetical protein